MTLFVIILVVLSWCVCDVQGKVDLKKNRIERIAFDGEELVISVDNSAGKKGELVICFASLPEETYRSCPSGFTGASVPILGYTKRELTLNREGQLMMTGRVNLMLLGSVEFNKDGTLNITDTELPNAWTVVTLQNAEIFVPDKPRENEVVKKKESNASVKVVAVVVVLILLGVIIGILVWFCVNRKSNSKQITECDLQDDSLTHRRKSLTPRNPSSKKPNKRASNRTTMTIQTTVSPNIRG